MATDYDTDGVVMVAIPADCGYDCGWKRGEACEFCQECVASIINKYVYLYIYI
jgi:hypothetical protein